MDTPTRKPDTTASQPASATSEVAAAETSPHQPDEGALPVGFGCPDCGYDLSRSPVHRCSECGRDVVLSDLANFSDQERLSTAASEMFDKRVVQSTVLLGLAAPLLCLGPMVFVVVAVPIAGLVFTPILTGQLLSRLLDGPQRARFRLHFFDRLWMWHRPWMTAILCAIPMPMLFHWADVKQWSNKPPIVGCVFLMAVWTVANVHWATRNALDPEWRRALSQISGWKRALITAAFLGLYAMSVPVLVFLVLLVARLFD